MVSFSAIMLFWYIFPVIVLFACNFLVSTFSLTERWKIKAPDLAIRTRPEAIKMAPLIKVLEEQSQGFDSVVVVTAQHRQMLDQVLEDFQITPNHDLNIMKDGQTLTDITSRVLNLLTEVLVTEQPDIVLVHGDTTTSFAAALAAFYQQIPVGHVEAGLRTWQKYSPFPEEMNRQLVDVLTDIYFAPTTQSKDNLIKENHPEEHIYVTGNTAIDAMAYTVDAHYQNDLLEKIPTDQRIVLITMHRRENLGLPMANVFKAVRRLVMEHPEIEVIFPMHKNPKVREIVAEHLGELARVHLIEPLDVKEIFMIVLRMLSLLRKKEFILLIVVLLVASKERGKERV